MRSSLPKVVHEVAGRSMVGHVVRAARQAGASNIIVVVGFKQERVREALKDEDVRFAVQDQQLGTGHAVACARQEFVEDPAATFVLNGDGPLLRAGTLSALAERHQSGDQPGAGVTISTVTVDNPTGLGRVVRNEEGAFQGIVEEADADAATRAIREVYPGIMMIGRDAWPRLEKLGQDNAQGEVYLTDLPRATVLDAFPVRTFEIQDPTEVLAANDRRELARLERVLQARLRDGWMRAGVTFLAPDSVFLHDDVALGRDVTLEPGVVLRRGTVIADRVTVGVGAVLTSCRVEEDATIAPYTVAEGRTFSGT